MNDFRKKLLAWFYKNHRRLPFRETKDPYKIWVSEVMLQQTRVSAMLSSYNDFINKFNSIQKLANAKEEDVLTAWKGLGYYSRAINLKKGAIYILEHYNGKFPENLEGALKVPGIGPYTARAILSISFDKPYAVLDGNVKRVLSRFYRFAENIDSPSSHKKIQNMADSFLNLQNPGDHNQAVMELGSEICLVKNPLCMYCPLSSECEAFKIGEQEKFPVKSKEREKIEITLNFFLIEISEHYLLIKDRNRRFFKTIYTPPYLIQGNRLPKIYENKKVEKLIGNLPEGKYLGSFNHTITHHKILVKIIHIPLNKKIQLDEKDEILWSKKNELEKYFASSIAKKILISNFMN